MPAYSLVDISPGWYSLPPILENNFAFIQSNWCNKETNDSSTIAKHLGNSVQEKTEAQSLG